MAIQSKSIDKLLVMKSKISEEADTPAIATASMPDTTGSLPIYNEAGAILGYIALYSNATLT